MKKIYAYIPFFILLAALCTSCWNELDDEIDGGENIVLKISLASSAADNATRSISETLDDAHVIVFDADGNVTGKAYRAFTDGTATIDVAVRTGTGCTLCAIANTGNKDFLNGISTLEALKKKTVTISAAADLGNKESEFLYGQLGDVTIGSNPPLQQLSLSRMYSKFTFKIIPSDGITLIDYQLCHVPLGSYVVPGNKSYAKTYADFEKVTLGDDAESATTPTYCIYENLAGEATASNSAANRNKTNAPKGASYLKITAKGEGWQSVYSIYLGGIEDTDYTNFNIPRNYNYQYTINITGSGKDDARVVFGTYMTEDASAVKWDSGGNGSSTAQDVLDVPPCDYYFSDGTWGKLAEHASETVYPIGMVFSYNTSTKDKELGFAKGYAVALRLTGEAVKWGSSRSPDELLLDNYLHASWDEAAANKDGYTENLTIRSKDIYSKERYPAFWAAEHFGTSEVPGTEIYKAPEKSSGWYLPSVGQWYDILVTLGGLNPVAKTYENSDTNLKGGIVWSGTSVIHLTGECLTAHINAAIEGDRSGRITKDDYYKNGDSWSSSEGYKERSVRQRFNKNVGTIYLALSYKTNEHYVRPVIAF